MSKKTYPIAFTKSSLLWDEKTDAWTYVSGKPTMDATPWQYWKIIPTLFRAVDLRATAVANLPWTLYRGETEYETSKDYQNKTGLVASMFNMLYLMEAALVLTGRAYWKREQNAANYDKLRHLDPTSLVLDEDKAKDGEIVWKRNENGTTKEYTPDEIIYLWGLDPYVEIGPPSSWPVHSALNACGVLGNLDEFAAAYFGRGAIKAMLFAMSGAGKTTAAEFESWWNRWIGGLKNVFRTKVINADKVTPVVVGEGIKELENVTLSQEKREEILIAMGVPPALVFSNIANYAEAKQQKLNWYEDKVVPEANFIAAILNEQVYEPLGLRLVFQPETLDIFQEDEKERGMALGYWVNAGVPLDISLRALGAELTDEDWQRITEQVERQDEQAAQMAETATQPPEPGQGVAFQPEDPKDKPDPFKKSLDDNHLKIGRELEIWRRKCESAVKKDRPAESVDFIPVVIPGEVYAAIIEKLPTAKDTDAVKHIFTTAMISEAPAQPANELGDLVQELKRRNDIEIWRGYP